MANVFKKLTTTPTRRVRKKGNLARGIGTENFGPTSQTGYYAGANPPANGYLVISLNSSNLPEYRAISSDEAMVQSAKDLGGDVSTPNEAKAYLRGRPDTWLLDSNLILDINFANSTSYPGTGNIVYDLSGNKNNLVIYGSSPYNNYSLGVGLEGSTTSYIQINPFPFPTNDYTLILTEKVNFNQSNALFSYEVANIGNTSLLYAPGGGMNFYGPSGAVGMGYTLPSNKWFQIARVRTKSTGQEKMYVNGVLVSTQTLATNTSTPTNGSLNIGQEQDSQGGGFDGFQTLNGYIANAKVYKSALSEEEIKSNFYKGPIITDNLILHLDPANPVCFEPGETVCYNTVTGGLVTGANGTPGSGTHTPDPSNFPAYNSVYDGVFDFNGGKGMNVDEDLGFTTTRTLSMWVYKNSASTQYFTDARNNGGQWFLSNYSSRNITYTNATSYNYGDSYNTNHPDFINKWIHITVTSDDNGGKIYLNGEEVNSYVSNSSIDEDFGKNFRIGTRYTVSAQWTGYMGPIVAYDRVLSDGEVKQNFNAHRSRYEI